MTNTTLKQIAVSEANYIALKRLVSAGDSFNDVITEMLRKVNGDVESRGFESRG